MALEAVTFFDSPLGRTGFHSHLTLASMQRSQGRPEKAGAGHDFLRLSEHLRTGREPRQVETDEEQSA